MKRKSRKQKHQESNEILKIYIDLIRSLVWSFYKVNNIEWDELFAEASLAYLEALQSYNPDHKNKKGSWIFQIVKNKLINFCILEDKISNGILHMDYHIDWIVTIEEPIYYEFMKRRFPRPLSEDVKIIVNMILRNSQYYAIPPRKVLYKVRKDLNSQGWEFQRIKKGIKDLNLEMNYVIN